MKKLLIPILILISLYTAASAYADTDTAGNTPAAYSSMKIQRDGQVISAGATSIVTTTTSLTSPTTLPTSQSTALQQQNGTAKHKFPKKQRTVIPEAQDKEQQEEQLEQLRSAPPIGVVPEATATATAFKKNGVGRVAVKGERTENPALSNLDEPTKKPTKTGVNLTRYFLIAFFLLATAVTLAKVKRTKKLPG